MPEHSRINDLLFATGVNHVLLIAFPACSIKDIWTCLLTSPIFSEIFWFAIFVKEHNSYAIGGSLSFFGFFKSSSSSSNSSSSSSSSSSSLPDFSCRSSAFPDGINWHSLTSAPIPWYSAYISWLGPRTEPIPYLNAAKKSNLSSTGMMVRSEALSENYKKMFWRSSMLSTEEMPKGSCLSLGKTLKPVF